MSSPPGLGWFPSLSQRLIISGRTAGMSFGISPATKIAIYSISAEILSFDNFCAAFVVSPRGHVKRRKFLAMLLIYCTLPALTGREILFCSENENFLFTGNFLYPIYIIHATQIHANSIRISLFVAKNMKGVKVFETD